MAKALTKGLFKTGYPEGLGRGLCVEVLPRDSKARVLTNAYAEALLSDLVTLCVALSSGQVSMIIH